MLKLFFLSVGTWDVKLYVLVTQSVVRVLMYLADGNPGNVSA